MRNYRIKIDNGDGEILFYQPGNVALQITEAHYKPVAGSAGSFTFTIPKSHAHFDKIIPLVTDIWLYKGDKRIFRGRYVGKEEDFLRTGKVTCEGDLNFLVDSMQDPYDHHGSIEEFFDLMLENHNKQMEPRKQFKRGIVNVVDDNNYIYRSNENYSTTADCMKNKLVKTHGGYLRTRYEEDGTYLDYVIDYGGINKQVIRFGENLIDLKNKIDASKIITCLIPVGATYPSYDREVTYGIGQKVINFGNLYQCKHIQYQVYSKKKTYEVDDLAVYSQALYKANQAITEPEEFTESKWTKIQDSEPEDFNIEFWDLLIENVGSGAASKIDISSVNDGKKYLESEEGISKWGRIWGTKEWDDVNLPENLKTKADAFLKEQIALPSTITLTAVDLSIIDVNIEELKIGFWTNVISRPHEITGQYLLKEADFDLVNPQNSKITIGDDKTSLSDSYTKQTADSSYRVEKMANYQAEWFTQAINYSTKLIQGGLGGYVLMPTNAQTGLPEEILIMDAPNKEKAVNLIRINKNGIGFSNTGYYGEYRNAWTIDGVLNADFIHTGTITAITIQNAKSGNRLVIDQTSSLKGYANDIMKNLINVCQMQSGTAQMTIDAQEQLNIRTPVLAVEAAAHGEAGSKPTQTRTGATSIISDVGKWYEGQGKDSHEIWVKNSGSEEGDVYCTLPVYLRITKSNVNSIHGMIVTDTKLPAYPI